MAPQIIDVRRHDAFEQSPHLLPGALWRDAGKAEQWERFDPTRPIIAACKAGHEMSQATVAQLRADGTTHAYWKAATKVDKGRPALCRQNGARANRSTPAEHLGDKAPSEDRPHRLSMADPPFPRSASAHYVRRS
jgi:rhodanese-related sulfurtransferase